MLNKIEKKKELSACSKPEKLSKYGIWRRENKNYGKILDMRAALKWSYISGYCRVYDTYQFGY